MVEWVIVFPVRIMSNKASKARIKYNSGNAIILGRKMYGHRIVRMRDYSKGISAALSPIVHRHRVCRRLILNQEICRIER